MRLRGTNGGGSNNTQLRFFGSNAGTDLWAIGTEVATGSTDRAFDFYDLVAGQNRIRITSGGNVLIGTTSEIGSGRRELVIRGENGSVISLGNNTTADRFQLVSDSGENALLNNKANTPMVFFTNNTQAMRITSNGNLLIGTTTDTGNDRRLQVSGNLFIDDNTTTGNGVQLKNADRPLITRGWDAFTSGNKTGVGRWGVYMESAELFLGSPGTDYSGGLVTIGGWLVNGTRQPNLTVNNQTRNVTATGSITATSFFESSDATIKTLVQDDYQAKGIESIVAKLYIKNGKHELGYFAQDLEGILPSAVNKGTDGLLNLSYREVHTAKIAYLEEEIRQIKKRYEIN
jgi:hypothetical protein